MQPSDMQAVMGLPVLSTLWTTVLHCQRKGRSHNTEYWQLTPSLALLKHTKITRIKYITSFTFKQTKRYIKIMNAACTVPSETMYINLNAQEIGMAEQFSFLVLPVLDHSHCCGWWDKMWANLVGSGQAAKKNGHIGWIGLISEKERTHCHLQCTSVTCVNTHTHTLAHTHCIIVHYTLRVAMERFSTTNVNPDLAKERQTRTFDSEILTRILYGGEWIVNKRRELGKYMSYGS